jgi:DNA-binding NarL/FixJ family response regulator
MPDGEAAFSFCGPRAAASLQDAQRDLAQAWRVILASQTDHVLTFAETIERQIDNLPPSAAIRCRAASRLVRSAVLASQNHSLAVLALVMSEAFAERDAGLDALLMEARGRPERYAVGRPRNGTEQPVSGSDAITARERDVLSMISLGRSNKHIARTLKISPETVKTHVKRIFSKLSVSTRTEAVSRAVSRGVL